MDHPGNPAALQDFAQDQVGILGKFVSGTHVLGRIQSKHVKRIVLNKRGQPPALPCQLAQAGLANGTLLSGCPYSLFVNMQVTRIKSGQLVQGGKIIDLHTAASKMQQLLFAQFAQHAVGMDWANCQTLRQFDLGHRQGKTI